MWPPRNGVCIFMCITLTTCVIHVVVLQRRSPFMHHRTNNPYSRLLVPPQAGNSWKTALDVRRGFHHLFRTIQSGRASMYPILPRRARRLSISFSTALEYGPWHSTAAGSGIGRSRLWSNYDSEQKDDSMSGRLVTSRASKPISV